MILALNWKEKKNEVFIINIFLIALDYLFTVMLPAACFMNSIIQRMNNRDAYAVVYIVCCYSFMLLVIINVVRIFYLLIKKKQKKAMLIVLLILTILLCFVCEVIDYGIRYVRIIDPEFDIIEYLEDGGLFMYRNVLKFFMVHIPLIDIFVYVMFKAKDEKEKENDNIIKEESKNDSLNN